MTNPVYRCPHCYGDIEVELDAHGQLMLNGHPSPKSKVKETEQ